MEQALDFLKSTSPIFVFIFGGLLWIVYFVIKSSKPSDKLKEEDNKVEEEPIKSVLGYFERVYQYEIDSLSEDIKKEILKDNSEEDKTYQPSPYQVSIKNPSNKTLNCSIFGFSEYIHTPNYGSDKDLEITSTPTDVSYLELLCQSAFKPFEVGMIRIWCKDLEQMKTTLHITYKDANGQVAQIPLNVKSYVDNCEIRHDWVDVNYSIGIDCGTKIQFPVNPNTSLTMTFYPKRKALSEEQIKINQLGKFANYIKDSRLKNK